MTHEQRPYYDLASDIVLLAIKDYYRVLVSEPIKDNGQRVPINQRMLELFFRSQWFGTLSDLDPDYLMALIKKLAAKKEGIARISVRTIERNDA